MKTRILTLIILLFGISLQGQDPAHHLPDTVWLKTGEVIPCKISSIDAIIIGIPYVDFVIKFGK